MSTAAKLKEILALTDYSLSMHSRGYPLQGQFVVTGPQMRGDDESRVGFCVQVRKGRGAFASSVVFLRHPGGGLTIHENQSFFSLTDAQEALAREIFVELPENEDYSQGYTIANEFHELGFLIETEGAHPRATAGGVHLTMNSTSADGNRNTTVVAFI